jgi:hypothetical protein
MAKLTLAVASLLALSFVATSVEAQAPLPSPFEQPVSVSLASAPAPTTADVTVATGPSMQAASLSPRYSSDQSLNANAMRRPSRGSGVGLMILGGAALITGLIIGDNAGTVIAVGGALIGLYGLYVYLGRPTGMEHSESVGLGYSLKTN